MAPTTSKITPFDFDAWLQRSAEGLSALGQRKLLAQDWITTGKAIRFSWLHARVTATLSRAVADPFLPMPELKWIAGFSPDLCIVDGSDQTQAVIEYESSNSSDERLVEKDLRHFEEAIGEYAPDNSYAYPEYGGWVETLPPWWVIVSTLPSCAVTGWKWYPYSTLKGIGPKVKDRHARDANPLKYYETSLHAAFAETWENLRSTFGGKDPKCSVVWVNLTESGLTVMNRNGKKVSEETLTVTLPPSVW